MVYRASGINVYLTDLVVLKNAEIHVDGSKLRAVGIPTPALADIPVECELSLRGVYGRFARLAVRISSLIPLDSEFSVTDVAGTVTRERGAAIECDVLRVVSFRRERL